MTVAVLLSPLEGVRQTGKDRWIARCPAHVDRQASLSIRELPDGKVLAHCFAGCSIAEVLSAAGVELDALFPEKTGAGLFDRHRTERRPFNPMDVLRCVSFEVAVALQFANAMRAGSTLPPDEHARLVTCCGRLVAALDIANG